MKRRLRRFLLIGTLITLVDVSVLLLLGQAWGDRWALANGAAVLIAAVASFVLHRAVTFADDAYSAIDHRPLVFAAAVAPALATDVAVMTIADVVFDLDATTVLVAKAVAVMCASVVRLVTYRGVLFAAVRSDQDQRPLPRAGVDGPRVSVVLPAYRAEDTVSDAIAAVRSALEAHLGSGADSAHPADSAAPGASQVEVVVVDDGSGDRTAELARAAGADQVVELDRNRGKGAAVRAGMLAANGRVRIFTDVDLAYPPEQLGPMVDALENGWEVVIGSRRHPDTREVNSASPLREVGSLLFNVLTLLTLLGRYRDTQCGLKGFSAASAEQVFSITIIDGFAFDVEVLHLIERLRLSLLEVPVVLDHVEASTVRLVPQALKMLRDVLAIRRHSAKGGYGISLDRADSAV